VVSEQEIKYGTVESGMHDLVSLVVMGCIPGACFVFQDKGLLWSLNIYIYLHKFRLSAMLYMNQHKIKDQIYLHM